MSPVEDLVGRLDRVKRTGSGTWLACCPAHRDKSPSLSIREGDDGRVLLHCFAGCEVSAIAAAVGMSLTDLFPPKPLGDRVAPVRRPFPAADVLEGVFHEALTVQQIAAEVNRSGVCSRDQRDRLGKSVQRITEARDLVNG